MLKLRMSGFRWDRDLQIIQADVRLEAEGTLLIDEPLCVDVGMPSLVNSLLEDVTPDRWAPPEEWRTKPFFVCGCGDPECRAYSIVVKHREGRVWLAEVDDRADGSRRIMEEFEAEPEEYRAAVLGAAQAFLDFAGGLDGYRPLYPGTLDIVRRLVGAVRS